MFHQVNLGVTTQKFNNDIFFIRRQMNSIDFQFHFILVHQLAASSMLYTTNRKHSLVLMMVGENYRPKHVELI